jgi:hypothetical protein
MHDLHFAKRNGAPDIVVKQLPVRSQPLQIARLVANNDQIGIRS